MKPAFVSSIYIITTTTTATTTTTEYLWGKSWEIISKSKKNNNEGPFLTKEYRS